MASLSHVRRALLLATIASLLVLPCIQLPAQATFGATGCATLLGVRQCVYKQPTVDVKYGWDGTVGNQIPDLDLAYDWIAKNVYDPTDLVFYRDLYGSTSGVDVIVADANWSSNGFYAWAECLPGSETGGSGKSRWCSPQKVRFNSYDLSVYGSTAAKRFMTCHETGHTVGVQHPEAPDTLTTCMRPGTWTTTNLSAAEKNQVNDAY